VTLSPQLLRIRHHAEAAGAVRFRPGKGCGHCAAAVSSEARDPRDDGLNDEIRELISTRAPIRQVKEAAARAGVRTLRETALDLVRRA